MDEPHIISFGDAATDNLYPALFQCFAIIICGYIAGRMNVVSPSESKGIATFVGTFALPSLIFLSLARLDFSTVNWTFLLAILLAKGIVFFSVIAVTLLVSKPLNLARAGIFAIFCTQSNDFALGYPIINAIYEKTHPEYALYLYLMAPISLAILNPIAFVLMEVNKQKESCQAISNEEERMKNFSKAKLLRQILKGIIYNPVLAMTVLGIIGNVIFKHNISIYIEGLLEVFGNAFSASALFLLGLRMVGQIHRLRGPALLLPCVLIMVKLIVLPVVMREFVSSLKAGYNESETTSLSTYAFLYGTIPTAPAVFVFSNLYQLEIDLMASSMVICTFLSAPMMYLSAQVISINKDYEDQLKKFGFELSIVALVAGLWVLTVFIVTKKYKRMPHRLTLCLLTSQILLAASVIWGGPLTKYTPSWHVMLQQSLRTFSMYSCLLWTSMLSVGILMLESRGPCFVVTLWPVLGFVAWGAPVVMVVILMVTQAGAGELNSNAVDAIRLCLLVFCLTVTTGCLIVYIRFRRRSAQFATLSAEVSGSSPPEETTSLVDNAEPVSNTQSISQNGCYGTITATPSPNRTINACCSDDPNCNNGLNGNGNDIEDIANDMRDCACPASQKHRCAETESCRYLTELEQAAGHLGLLPPEQTRGRGTQLLKHTVLIIVYSLSMFIGITYATWKIMKKDESGVFVEIEFFDIAANYGQVLLMFILFGLDPEEIFIPTVRYFQKKFHGADTLVLPSVDDLSFETKHVCDQFITHHLERCKEAIAKDTRWRMRTYHGVFRGSCLVHWLMNCGLAKDEHEAVTYGRHLLDGRLIAHINNAHHFSNSPLLYTFK
ncbi:integral membrane protein GPR155 [Pectinophora gossypiella]|uniref:integral membrane protein GPR155 n=1 Tax=Pectinophora gossypiella TaxID=13191 RepID=UPI00214F3FFF|nr:integral membrane protein GPR155 [Pectinophora gossypiella]XP_049873991.1 integral membrane protein GPR155 [Pectinophora gossypiella]